MCFLFISQLGENSTGPPPSQDLEGGVHTGGDVSMFMGEDFFLHLLIPGTVSTALQGVSRRTSDSYPPPSFAQRGLCSWSPLPRTSPDKAEDSLCLP